MPTGCGKQSMKHRVSFPILQLHPCVLLPPDAFNVSPPCLVVPWPWKSAEVNDLRRQGIDELTLSTRFVREKFRQYNLTLASTKRQATIMSRIVPLKWGNEHADGVPHLAKTVKYERRETSIPTAFRIRCPCRKPSVPALRSAVSVVP